MARGIPLQVVTLWCFNLVETIHVDIDARLAAIFREILDLPPHEDPRTIRRLGDERWDSVAHVSLVAALESEFGFVLSIADFEELSSFESARMLISEKIP